MGCKSRLTVWKVQLKQEKDRIGAAVYLRENYGHFKNKDIAHVLGVRDYTVSKHLTNSIIVPRQKTLTEEEEEIVIDRIKNSIIQGRPMKKTDVKILALNLWSQRTGIKRDKMLSDSWWKSFRSRWVGLKLRYIKSQDYKRAIAEQKTNCDLYNNETREYIRNHNIKQENVFNIDEKGIIFTDTKSKVVIFVHKNAKETLKPQVYKQTQSQHFTLVGAITASGTSLKPYYIIQFPKTKNWEIVGKNAYGYLEVNKSGYVDETIKLDCVKFFVNQMTEPGPKLLLVDNHGSNFSPELIEWARENDVHIKTFPSNMTHKLQPLDLVIFSSFSAALKNIILKEIQADPKFKVTPNLYQQLSYYAWIEATKPTNVMAAWSKAGMIKCSPRFPVDMDLIPKPKSTPKKSSKALTVVDDSTKALVTTDGLSHKQRSMMMRDNMSQGTVWTDDSNSDLIVHYKKETRKRKESKKSATGDINLQQTNNYNTFNQINVNGEVVLDENTRPIKKLTLNNTVTSSSTSTATIQDQSIVSSFKSLFNKLF